MLSISNCHHHNASTCLCFVFPVYLCHFSRVHFAGTSHCWRFVLAGISMFVCFSLRKLCFRASKIVNLQAYKWTDVPVIRKTPKKQQNISWMENECVLSNSVPQAIRLMQKKSAFFAIGDVHHGGRVSDNWVYVLSRVRTNPVSLH